MPTQTDHMLARYVHELEDRQQFIDSLVETATNESRDLSTEEMELATRARDRIAQVNGMMQPLEESRRISGDATARVAELARFMANEPDQPA